MLKVNYKSETHVSKCLTNTSIVKTKIQWQNEWVCSANKNITYDTWLLSLLSMIRPSLRFGCSGLSTARYKTDMFIEDGEDIIF